MKKRRTPSSTTASPFSKARLLRMRNLQNHQCTKTKNEDNSRQHNKRTTYTSLLGRSTRSPFATLSDIIREQFSTNSCQLLGKFAPYFSLKQKMTEGLQFTPETSVTDILAKQILSRHCLPPINPLQFKGKQMADYSNLTSAGSSN